MKIQQIPVSNAKVHLFDLYGVADVNFDFQIINNQNEIQLNVTKNDAASQIEEISIVSLDGKLLKAVASTDKSQVVKVDDLSGGAYLVRYLIDGTYYSRKFIL